MTPARPVDLALDHIAITIVTKDHTDVEEPPDVAGGTARHSALSYGSAAHRFDSGGLQPGHARARWWKFAAAHALDWRRGEAPQ